MEKATTAIATMLTTSIKKTGLPPFFVLGLAIVLLLLSVPALLARLAELPTQHVRSALYKNAPLTEEQQRRFEVSRVHLLSWFHDPAYYDDLALSFYVRGSKLKTAQERNAYFKESVAWEMKALRANPADPFGWYRLSYLYYQIDQTPSLRTAAAWTQSMAVAPYEPNLMLTRLELGIDNYFYLTEEGKAFIPLLIQGASVFDADALARMAIKKSFIMMVEDALANDPAALTYFRGQVRKLTSAS